MKNMANVYCSNNIVILETYINLGCLFFAAQMKKNESRQIFWAQLQKHLA